jgi:hypothetical protein
MFVQIHNEWKRFEELCDGNTLRGLEDLNPLSKRWCPIK